jgi:chlorite dismutase/heme-degrading monooxygenase HmoA
MEQREPPLTAEGSYVLHDFRTVDWDAWRAAPEREREHALEEGEDFLVHREHAAHSDGGESALYSILGHKADLLFVHLRPTMADLDRIERSFEDTALAAFTERATSYVSVTEASGYGEQTREYLAGETDDDAAIGDYIDDRLHPEIPDSEFVSFYPMSKRRQPEQNWYDTSYDDRAEHITRHADIGRDYAGEVEQMICSSVGMDDHEWGITLWADDLTNVKDLLNEMRFDPSTSQFADFGAFYVGRRFPPVDLAAFFAGDPIPVPESERENAEHAHDESENAEHAHDESEDAEHAHDESEDAEHAHDESEDAGGPPADVRDELEAEGVYGGQPHGEDVYAVVLYSEADVDELYEEMDGLRGNFEHYDRHVKTAVYENPDGPHAVASVWEAQEAADTASGFLTDLPGVVRQAGDDADSDTWGTMGMFYTTKPDRREEFVDKFETVGGVLADMDGHVQTDLLANVEDESDMFIASRWDSREDAMSFFRSDAFTDTVDWGRDVLADRPRHVFLA